MPWCPYTDLDLPDEATNSEHIIPLSLGGANAFCIPVQKDFNTRIGSKIDGVLANDFFISIRRREFDARGHSKNQPKAILRDSRLSDGRPVQVTLLGNHAPLVWDAMANNCLQEPDVVGEEISSRFKIGMHDRKRFLAKVSLAAGYFIYGDLFRNLVRHSELRVLMNFDSSTAPDSFSGFSLRGYDEFSPVKEADVNSVELDKFFCGLINGSCVITIPGPQKVGFIVGILGKWIGTLNVPASTDSFPADGEHDLGHVIALHEGQMSKMSYRQLAEHAHSTINRENPS